MNSNQELPFRKTLYVCSYPPCSLAGAPIIAKQLLRAFDMDKLTVICDRSHYDAASTHNRASLLDCRHETIRKWWPMDLRPRRLFGPYREAVNACRIAQIRRKVVRISKEDQSEIIFAPLGHVEFGIAAYQAAMETGLPLYVFETDDWVWSSSISPVPHWLAKKYQRPVLQSAAKVWCTSPAMVRDYRERFQIEPSFLFNFLSYVPERGVPDPVEVPIKSTIDIVYTGAVNSMFHSTMEWLCGRINNGLAIRDRTVKLHLYTGTNGQVFSGENVQFHGLVPHSEIPAVLANADILLIAVSFSEDPAIRRLIRTSLYTKTVDYLAAGRPVLVLAPRETAEVEYFGDVTHVIDKLEATAVLDAIKKLAFDQAYVAHLTTQGLDFVHRKHSPVACEATFLKNFRQCLELKENKESGRTPNSIV